MNFDNQRDYLTSFLTERRFSISDKTKNYIQYNSKKVSTVFSYDEKEDTFSIYIGKRNEDLSLLTEDILENVFKEINYYKLNKPEIDNFILFLENKGSGILAGDEKILKLLVNYSDQSAKEYTESIDRGQQISKADEAWINKDYLSFLKALNSIDKAFLSATYLKKYEFAKKMVN